VDYNIRAAKRTCTGQYIIPKNDLFDPAMFYNQHIYDPHANMGRGIFIRRIKIF